MIQNLFFKLESKLSDADIYAFSKMGIYDSILSGTGLIYDHYYGAASIAKACLHLGMPAVIAPTIQDLSGPGMDKQELAFLDVEMIHHSEIFKKNQIHSALGPHAMDTVSRSLLHRINQYASKLGLVLHMHMAQTQDELKFCLEKYNRTPLEFFKESGCFDHKSLLVHGIFLSDQDLIRLKNSKHLLVFCPSSQQFFAHQAYVIKWNKHKIPYVLATDTAASNDSSNLQKELRMTSAMYGFQFTFNSKFNKKKWTQAGLQEMQKQKGRFISSQKNFLDPELLWSKITTMPGGFHPTLKAGKIEKGYLANLLFWNPKHPSLWPFEGLKSLVFTDSLPAIEGFMLKGRWMGSKNGIDPHWRENLLSSTDYQDSVKEATALRKQLLN